MITVVLPLAIAMTDSPEPEMEAAATLESVLEAT
jgi:hypothetical protein